MEKNSSLDVLTESNFSSLLPKNRRLAEYQYECIMRSIHYFEAELDKSHEVAIKLASFGQTILMQVTNIGYSNPSLIHFYGYVNGARSELIQHVNQLSFLLTSVPSSDPQKPPKRIGFVMSESR